MRNLARDTFCSYCGARHAATAYPRTCPGCGVQLWANPVPVSVVLVPVRVGVDIGLLVVRRAIPPQVGKLALAGGFLEEHETWQVGGAREVREEAGTLLDPSTLTPFWFTSTEPRPNRVLLFSEAPPVDANNLSAFARGTETSERGVVFGPGGLDDVFAFPLHAEAARRWFAVHRQEGAHRYARV